MHTHMSQEELTAEVLRLTVRCQQGDAHEDEYERLNILLGDSEEARRIYLSAADDTVTLTDESISQTIVSPAARADQRSQVRGKPGFRRTASNRSRRYLFMAGACLAVLFAGVWGGLPFDNLAFDESHSRGNDLAADVPSSQFQATGSTESRSEAAAPEESQQFCGRIIDLANVVWSADAPRYRAWSRVAIGSEIRFESGVAELMLDNGAQIVLQGPADFTLVSTRRAVAKRGKLVLRCGPDAVGFEIESPDAKVVDLGTVFGLSIVDGTSTNVVVYEGSVDLSVRAAKAGTDRRLTAGEALKIARNGEIGRITAVQTPLFLPPPDLLARGDGSSELIGSVSDSLRSEETSKYYRVIGQGFGEDCRAYVDRLHEWNGIDSQGIPRFLRGGDYVMTFNDDKLRNIQIALELLRPARVYVLMDDRVTPPRWLTTNFEDTGWDLGLDAYIVSNKKSRFAASQLHAEVGPGRSIDSIFSVWQQDIFHPAVVELGSLRGDDLVDVDPYSIKQSMYGVVVQPLQNRLGAR